MMTTALIARQAVSAEPLTVLHVGQEGEPVVVLDDATGAVPALVDFAATRSQFQAAGAIGSFYPGLLGTAPTPYIHSLVERVLPLIAAHFGTGPVRPARARGNFSLVTTPAAALSPDQRVPHVDAADRMQFAVVHYLSYADWGGTGFYRHRATGYETVDPERLPAYRRALDAELAAPAPASGYVDGDHPLFERIGAVTPAPDRLVLYRAALLHSGLIAEVPPHAADPRRGRLTGNLFLQCRAAA